MSDSTTDNSNNTTRASLLVRLKNVGDGEAWSDFHDLYAPLLYDYARSRGLNHEDAEDIRSECYASLVRQMKEFQYDRSKGSFKSWLRTMVSRRVIDRLRKRRERHADSKLLRDLTNGEPSDEQAWETEWKRQHLRFCVDQSRPQVSEQTWNAFRMLAENGDSVDTVCESLKMTPSQVYKAKARMLALVREKMRYLLTDVE